MTFNVGEKVRCVRHYPGLEIGETGVYLGYGRDKSPLDAAVRWDKYVERRHACGNRCERGHGWYVPVDKLDFGIPDDLGELPKADSHDVSKFLFGM